MTQLIAPQPFTTCRPLAVGQGKDERGGVGTSAAPIPGPSAYRRLTVSLSYINGSADGWKRSQEIPIHPR